LGELLEVVETAALFVEQSLLTLADEVALAGGLGKSRKGEKAEERKDGKVPERFFWIATGLRPSQ
jgi:hypothetical protein